MIKTQKNYTFNHMKPLVFIRNDKHMLDKTYSISVVRASRPNRLSHLPNERTNSTQKTNLVSDIAIQPTWDLSHNL